MHTILEAIEAFRRGEMVILMDDENRENEGDLIIAADAVTPEVVTFMSREGKGLICLAMAPELVDALHLPLMPQIGAVHRDTAFVASIEARDGITTGISSKERVHTIMTAVREGVTPDEIVSPGHIFPLRAHPDGVLGRDGHTEGSVDLARLAGRRPAAVICETLNDDGTMARLPDLEIFAKKHGLVLATVADLVAYRRAQG